MTEIRSYRRVFDLERRIYSVDRVRLNPGGVPVRGVLYLLGLAGSFTLAARLPGVGTLLSLVPWYLRYVVLPVAAAALLVALRLDGRTFHLTAVSLARFLGRPSRTTALARASRAGRTWRPQEIVFLPDGSDHELRALRYLGPGAVRVNVSHHCGHAVSTVSGSRVVRLSGAARVKGHGARVLALERGVQLVVVHGRRR